MDGSRHINRDLCLPSRQRALLLTGSIEDYRLFLGMQPIKDAADHRCAKTSNTSMDFRYIGTSSPPNRKIIPSLLRVYHYYTLTVNLSQDYFIFGIGRLPCHHDLQDNSKKAFAASEDRGSKCLILCQSNMSICMIRRYVSCYASLDVVHRRGSFKAGDDIPLPIDEEFGKVPFDFQKGKYPSCLRDPAIHPASLYQSQEHTFHRLP